MLLLTKLRMSAGKSKAALAREASLDAAYLGKIEHGRVVPYRGQLARLAVALALPADQADMLMQAVSCTPLAGGGD